MFIIDKKKRLAEPQNKFGIVLLLVLGIVGFIFKSISYNAVITEYPIFNSKQVISKNESNRFENFNSVNPTFYTSKIAQQDGISTNDSIYSVLLSSMNIEEVSFRDWTKNSWRKNAPDYLKRPLKNGSINLYYDTQNKRVVDPKIMNQAYIECAKFHQEFRVIDATDRGINLRKQDRRFNKFNSGIVWLVDKDFLYYRIFRNPATVKLQDCKYFNRENQTVQLVTIYYNLSDDTCVIVQRKRILEITTANRSEFAEIFVFHTYNIEQSEELLLPEGV